MAEPIVDVVSGIAEDVLSYGSIDDISTSPVPRLPSSAQRSDIPSPSLVTNIQVVAHLVRNPPPSSHQPRVWHLLLQSSLDARHFFFPLSSLGPLGLGSCPHLFSLTDRRCGASKLVRWGRGDNWPLRASQ